MLLNLEVDATDVYLKEHLLEENDKKEAQFLGTSGSPKIEHPHNTVSDTTSPLDTNGSLNFGLDLEEETHLVNYSAINDRASGNTK